MHHIRCQDGQHHEIARLLRLPRPQGSPPPYLASAPSCRSLNRNYLALATLMLRHLTTYCCRYNQYAMHAPKHAHDRWRSSGLCRCRNCCGEVHAAYSLLKWLTWASNSTLQLRPSASLFFCTRGTGIDCSNRTLSRMV